MRSGNLLAKNDVYINEIINSPLYDIREDGTVWTLICETGKVSANGVWRQAGYENADGYREISYTPENSSAKSILVHRIIYRRFLGQLFEDLIVNHKDGVRTNNSVSNLELITQSDNIKHRFQVLGRKPVIGNKKISDEIADAIRNDHASGMSYNALRDKYKISKSSISYLINRKTWNRKIQSNHEFTYKTKINQSIADEIRSSYKNGAKQKNLANSYAVSLTTIKDICANRTWAK